MSVLYGQWSGERFVSRLHCPLFEIFCCSLCFQVHVPWCRDAFINNVMDILVLDLLGGVRWAAHSPIQTADLQRNCLLVVMCTKASGKNRTGFLSSLEALDSF